MLLNGLRLTKIGHVIGLELEHQRSDRGAFVDFRCSNVINYKAVKAEVALSGDPNLGDFEDADERIELA